MIPGGGLLSSGRGGNRRGDRRIADTRLLLAAMLIAAGSAPHPATAAEASEVASDASAPFVQRWGLDSASGSMDYHAGTNRLLTAHRRWAVLWDVATGMALEEFPIGGGAVAVAFDGDGRQVLTASGDGPLRVWDVQTGERIAEFETPPSPVHAAAISPDGRYVAAGCYDHAVLVGEVGTGRELQRLDEHRGHVIFVRFSPDSRRLLSGSYDAQAILWDVQTGRPDRIFPTPVETRWADFRADGRRLLTLGSGTERGMGRVIQWDIATRQPVQVIDESVRLAWFVDQDVAVLMPDNELRLYRRSEQDLPHAADPAVLAPAMLSGLRERLSVLAGGWRVGSPGQLAETAAGEAASEHAEAAVLRSPTGKTMPLPLPLKGSDPVEFVTVSPDGRWLLTSVRQPMPRGDRTRLVLWDLAAPGVVRSFPGTMGRFHPDGQRVVAGEARKLQLFRIADGQPLQTFEIDSGAFESARFVADGRQLLTASGDWYDGNEGRVMLWDVEKGEVLRDYFADGTAAYQAVMDREEKRMLAAFTYGESGGIDRLGLYDADSTEPLHVMSKDDHALWALRAAPQVNRFAAGNERQTSVWDLTDSRLLHQFPGLPGPFSADGNVIATFLRAARATLLWDLEDGRYLGSFDAEITGFHPGSAVAFMQDHRAALGLLDLRTGRQIAELFTFGDQWLAVTAAGDLAGSDEALRRVTWRVRRQEQDTEVAADPEHSARQYRPQQVADALTRFLPDGQSLTDALADRTPVLPEGIQHQIGPPDRPQLTVRSAEAPACTWLDADAEGRLLLASYEDGSAALWQLRPIPFVRQFPSIGRRPRIALTPDGAVAIVEGPERADLTLWDTGTGRQQGLLKTPDKERDERIAALAMHPQGRLLGVLYHGLDDGSIGRTMIWNLQTGRVAHRLIDPSPRRMTDIAFTPDGHRLVVGYRTALKDQDQPWDRIDVWDWQSETRERTIRGSGFGATSLAFSGDGQRLLVKEGWELVVRDFQTGEVLARRSYRHGIPAGVLSGDGATIVGSTLGDGRLFRSTVAEPEQWTWTPPAEGRFPNRRYAYADKLLVMEDRNLVFSPGNDGRIHVWSLDSLRPVADLFTRNGHRDWIARTSSGVFTATEGTGPQLAWEYGGRRWPLKRLSDGWTIRKRSRRFSTASRSIRRKCPPKPWRKRKHSTWWTKRPLHRTPRPAPCVGVPPNG
jgi:WD40 repeat protein